MIGAERFRALQPLRADVERDHLGAHRLGVLGGRQSHRALAEDRQRVVAGKGSCGVVRCRRCRKPAGDRGACRKRQFVRQRHQRVGGHLEILRVAAMGVVAIDLDRHLLAELLPSGAAMVALGAALIVMHHHALADPRLLRVDRCADRDHYGRRVHARRSRDRRPPEYRLPAPRSLGASVLVQVAADMPDAFISITTSWVSGVGSENGISSSSRSPVKDYARMISSACSCLWGDFERKKRVWQRAAHGYDVFVVPGRAKREPQMCNCTSGNLEIPGSRFASAPE